MLAMSVIGRVLARHVQFGLVLAVTIWWLAVVIVLLVVLPWRQRRRA
jgi:hypothetical protein